MKYWIFNGTPWNKRAYKTLPEVRLAAIRKLKENNRDSVAIVTADEEPYDWKGNYQIVGKIVRQLEWNESSWQWYPIEKGQEPKTITASGNLGSVIASHKRAWRK